MEGLIENCTLSQVQASSVPNETRIIRTLLVDEVKSLTRGST